MSNVEQALRSILVADNGVKAITTRCYPVANLQQPAQYPYIIYTKVTGHRDHALSGPTGLANPRFQVEAWASTYNGAKALANAIRAALDGKKFTTGGVVIGSVLIQSERDDYDYEAKAHRVMMDFSVWHDE